jgi:hypothetical protein
MIHRILLLGAILLFVLSLIPACTRNTSDTNKDKLPPDYNYEPPPEPKAAGKSG